MIIAGMKRRSYEGFDARIPVARGPFHGDPAAGSGGEEFYAALGQGFAHGRGRKAPGVAESAAGNGRFWPHRVVKRGQHA